MNEESVVCEQVTKPKRFLSVAQRAEWVRRFVDSGLSVPQFCDEHGLLRANLYRWLRRQERPAVAVRAPAEAMPAFTEIKFSAASAAGAWAAELCRPNGVVLRVTPELPAALLKELLRLC